jgi:hypothetical protein
MQPPELAPAHEVRRLSKSATTPADESMRLQGRAATVASDSAAAPDVQRDENPLWVTATVVAVLCGIVGTVVALS